MAYEVINLTCPGCGARVSIGQKVCEYCDSPVMISTFNSVYAMSMPEVTKRANSYKNALQENPDHEALNSAVAMCHLKLKRYDKALEAFERAIDADIDNSESYFYAAVSLLQGKKAFLQQRPVIDKIQEYINAAIMLEPKGIYYYFLAYIKYDYFERKYLNTTPDYRACLRTAAQYGVSEYDKHMLFDILGVAVPACM